MKIVTPKNISKTIIILPIVGIIINTILIASVTIYSIKENFQTQKEKITANFMQELKVTTKKRVDMAYNIIDVIYHATQKNIPLIQKILDKMRWENKGYVFVLDFYGNTLYHPNKEYMKINRWNFERNGVKVIRLLIQSAIKHPNGTYVKYLAYNPDGVPQEKVSFVRVYKPLGIVIGSGVYLNYLDKKLLQAQKNEEHMLEDVIEKIVLISLIIPIFIIVIVYYLLSKLTSMLQEMYNEIAIEKRRLFIKANYDSLTGVLNRSYFLTKLDQYIDTSLRENKKFAILFIDLDHFKEINDSLGHQVGDEVLKIIAKRLQDSIRKNDLVARFGGDEFIVLLNDIKSVEELSASAQRILDKIKSPVVLYNKKYYLSVSIGISIFPDDAKDKHKLIKYADTAMYKAKKSGKDRFVFYAQYMTQETNYKMELKHSLYHALEDNQLCVCFQPQCDKNDKLVGIEALIRWKHPEYGELLPNDFIPLAIENGIIDKVDLWMFEHSIKLYQEIESQGFNIGVLSCNISMYQLEKSNFYDILQTILDKYNFDPKRLNIEITEESIMQNPKKSISILNKLTSMGIGINIDDFGTGYSSLSYLKKLPVSKLKIDKSFISDIPDNKDDEIIVKTIIDLAKNLNLEVIAEGIETQAQKEFVFNNGCDYMQGFLYAKPLYKEDFLQFLKRITNGS